MLSKIVVVLFGVFVLVTAYKLGTIGKKNGSKTKHAH